MRRRASLLGPKPAAPASTALSRPKRRSFTPSQLLTTCQVPNVQRCNIDEAHRARQSVRATKTVIPCWGVSASPSPLPVASDAVVADDVAPLTAARSLQSRTDDRTCSLTHHRCSECGCAVFCAHAVARVSRGALPETVAYARQRATIGREAGGNVLFLHACPVDGALSSVGGSR